MSNKYILRAYEVVAVVVNRTEPDGRTFVSEPNHFDEFWVGTHRVYDTVEDCVKGDRDIIKQGISQKEYELKELTDDIDAMKKLLEVA